MYIFVIAVSLGFLLIIPEAIVAITPEEQEDHPNFKLLPQPPDCSKSQGDDRIVGGDFAAIGQFPWLARIGYLLDNCDGPSNTPMFSCAGALITPCFVLTASHCVGIDQKLDCLHTGIQEQILLKFVRLGEFDQTTSVDCEDNLCADATQDVYVMRITSHENYDEDNIINDIALLELEENVRISDWVNPVCLPVGDMLLRDYVGYKAQVAGWGRTGNTGVSNEISPDILKVVHLPIKDVSECQPHFSSMNPDGGQHCVGGQKGQDSCTGDSGGPLMVVDTDSGSPKEYLLGIVSYGYLECGADGVPAVYTDVRFYMDWLLDNLTS